MIIVVTLLIILAVIVCYITNDNGYDGTSITSAVGAVCLGILDTILIIWCLTCGSSMFTIDDTIKMYQEENKTIEEQMTTIVQNYQGYEERTIKNIADMELMILKFPELKTSELVSKQIDVYVKNNNEIKKLKKEKIETKVAKWLLYFGN